MNNLLDLTSGDAKAPLFDEPIGDAAAEEVDGQADLEAVLENLLKKTLKRDEADVLRRAA